VLRRPLVALVALAAVGLLAAGCGSNGSGSGGYGSSGTAPASGGASSVATVSATSTNLGMILVDGSGRTLYLFEKDQPNQSACAGACVAAWFVVGPTGGAVGGGATATTGGGYGG
jgi:predicted lipoprotein with Yx(FWY)xxD motif